MKRTVAKEVKAERERGEVKWRRGKERERRSRGPRETRGPMAVAGTGIGIVHVYLGFVYFHLKKNSKFFKISYHIESLDAYIKY